MRMRAAGSDDWVIDGAKQFITNAGTEISGCVTITRTEEDLYTITESDTTIREEVHNPPGDRDNGTIYPSPRTVEIERQYVQRDSVVEREVLEAGPQPGVAFPAVKEQGMADEQRGAVWCQGSGIGLAVDQEARCPGDVMLRGRVAVHLHQLVDFAAVGEAGAALR